MKAVSLKNQVAVVTGARRGIGEAVALALAEAEAEVVAVDIEVADGGLERLRRHLAALGRRAIAVQADVARADSVDSMVRAAVQEFRRVDILVCCAGVWIPGQTLIECSLENWDRVIDTNLKGTFLCCRAAGALMARQKGGCIINIASQVGLTPGPGTGAYCISKSGIIMLTRQMALELAGFNVRVNAIAPGIIKTEFNAAFWKDPAVERQTARMVPLGRLAEPREVAECALFLASEGASYITGEVLCASGGWTPSSPVGS